MEDNKDLLQALDGIRVELQLLNKTLSSIAAQQGRVSQPSASSAGRPPMGRPPVSSGRYTQSRPSTSRGPATGGFKRSAEEGEPTGYGAEMAARFPRKKGPARPKNKPPAKKGGGYPKKPR